ncbi:MAG: hypothetical protein U0231_01950 [Nitrospiraceae bacterium]
MFFLVVTTVVGLGIGYNVLSTPPIMPYGTLHLIAYTHLTFSSFLLHATIGGLAFCLRSCRPIESPATKAAGVSG